MSKVSTTLGSCSLIIFEATEGLNPRLTKASVAYLATPSIGNLGNTLVIAPAIPTLGVAKKSTTVDNIPVANSEVSPSAYPVISIIGSEAHTLSRLPSFRFNSVVFNFFIFSALCSSVKSASE